jgi:hypothetical protein
VGMGKVYEGATRIQGRALVTGVRTGDDIRGGCWGRLAHQSGVDRRRTHRRESSWET